jgi:hypothetical protein
VIIANLGYYENVFGKVVFSELQIASE